MTCAPRASILAACILLAAAGAGPGIAAPVSRAPVAEAPVSAPLDSEAPGSGTPGAVTHAGPESPPPADAWRATALATFDQVWSVIDATHFDPNHNGVDWDAARDAFRPQAEAARDNTELREVLWRLLGRLDQSHFGIIPKEFLTLDAIPADPTDEEIARRILTAVPGHLGWPAPGFDLQFLESRPVVTRVWPGSDAESRGVRPGWELTSVNGQAIPDAAAFVHAFTGRILPADPPESHRQITLWLYLTCKLAGPDSTMVRSGFLQPDGSAAEFTLLRRPGPGRNVSFPGMPPLRLEFHTTQVSRDPDVVAVSFNWWLPPVFTEFEAVFDDIRAADAVILDLRGNLGGVGQVGQALAGYLCPEPGTLGSFVGRSARLEYTYEPRSRDKGGPAFAGPLAVLTDGLSASTSEVMAAGLVDSGRARLFGTPTAGAALPAQITELPTGDQLLHATFNYIRPNGEVVEANPVRPHQVVALTAKDVAAGTDPVMDAAVTWIRGQLAR